MRTQGLPQHVAIIMDGNGRWAQRLGRPRIYGHVRGCGRVREVIREASRLNLKALTLYAFSSENWQRPPLEVNTLMRLLKKWLIRERRELLEKNIRFRAIGRVELLPAEIRELVRSTQEVSKNNTGLQLTLALSYGGRDEIVEVARSLARKVKLGESTPEQITEESFASELLTAEVGDPDLLIRTSGEQRISNFLLWQLAYTELYFTDLMWPDFHLTDFHRALDSFGDRERRFGMISAQLEALSI